MSEAWYYVQSGERKGPVEKNELLALITASELNESDYVWKKGFENWTRILEVDELNLPPVDVAPPMPPVLEEVQRLQDYIDQEKNFFVKIGMDRGGKEAEYGPYQISILKQLFDQNRINAKTFIFVEGMQEWKALADFEDFETVFSQTPPVIEEVERRSYKRRPLIARMFIENQKQVYLGMCRDVSIGGMQVLVDHFPAVIGDRISLNVHPDNSDYHFVASGEIVRLLDGNQGFSFRFIDLSDESIRSIEKYVRESE